MDILNKTDLSEVVSENGSLKNESENRNDQSLLNKKKKRDIHFKHLSSMGLTNSRNWQSFAIMEELVNKLKESFPEHSTKLILDLLEKSSLNIPYTIAFLREPHEMRFELISQLFLAQRRFHFEENGLQS